MFHMLYISFSGKNHDVNELISILDVANRKNVASNITGLLLYNDQVFLQLLEGEKENVMQTYYRILKDPRHTQVTILSEGEYTGARLFPNWKMGFYHMKYLDKLALPGLVPQDIGDIQASLVQQKHLPHAVVIDTFIRSNMKYATT